MIELKKPLSALDSMKNWFTRLLFGNRPILIYQELNSKKYSQYLYQTTPWYKELIDKKIPGWESPTARIDKIHTFPDSTIYLIQVSWPYWVDKGFYYMTLTNKNIRRFL